MATVKYKEPSPYTKPRRSPPEDDFLHTSYEAAVNLDPSTKPSVKPVVVALFGVGRAGQIHLNNLINHHHVKIAYIVDDVESKWSSLKAYWNLTDTTFLSSKQSDKVFSDERVVAVIVASPTYTHEEIVRKALESRKAVFCEKPIAEDIATTKKLYELADKVGKPLFCAFNRRFDPAYSNLRKDVHKGKVGHVHTIKICARDSPLPTVSYIRTSGGIFHDCAIHDIDMMCWILGELPNKVFAMANANIPEMAEINDFDTIAMVLNFPSGTIGMIDISRNACYGYDQRIEVFGPRGMLQCNGENPMCGYDSYLGSGGQTKTPIYYSFPSRYKIAYSREMAHFFNIVEGKEKISILGRETLAASKIASAMEESARTGKYVELQWEPNELPANA
ncbi:uncharacterized oxidoreductase YrbE [Anabrus simplex]|uniref:uncharacterized oxidoreductase YrbE n=1 Tax=Anabrus simplex TaxID=316456 RepID=UPI0035A3A1BC